MTDYQAKYMKYKTKYLNLKKQLIPINQTGGRQFTIEIRDPWFTEIERGHKTIDADLRRGNFIKFKPNDIIEWTNKELSIPRSVRTQITKVQRFPNFFSMLYELGFKSIFPISEVDTYEDALDIYANKFTREEEKKFGVVAINFMKIK